MPRQLWIDDHIEFRGDAKHRSNIDGPMQRTMVHFHDHFLGHTLDTVQLYTSTTGDSSAIAIVAAAGGQCRITTAAADPNVCFLSTAVNWEDDKYAVCEARIKIATVANTHIFFGFSDEVEETSPDTPIDYDGGSKATAATVAVGFVVDPDKDASSIMCSAVGATDVDSAEDWADGVWHTLRIELNPDGDAWYYIDGESVAFIADAIATSGTDLCMMLCASVRTTGAKYVYLDYWDAWQDK